MTPTPALYKFTNGPRPVHGSGVYPTRKDGRTLSTAWLPARTPILCESGWHVTTAEYLPHHIGADLYLVEVKGIAAHGATKSAHERLRFVRRIRQWDRRAVDDFAQFCAANAAAYAAANAAAYAAAYAASADSAYAAKAARAAAAANAKAARAGERNRQAAWIIERCGL